MSGGSPECSETWKVTEQAFFLAQKEGANQISSLTVKEVDN